MVEQVVLPVRQDDTGRSVMFFWSHICGPPINFGLRDGTAFLCGQCGQVLAVGVINNIYSITIVCPVCKALNDTPEPPASLPIGNCAVVPPGRYGFATDLYLEPTALIVGESATLSQSAYPQSVVFSHAGYAAARARLEALFGEGLTKIESSTRRGNSSKTKPTRPHRLGSILAAVQCDAFKSTPEATGHAGAELSTAVLVFETWNRHPVWPSIAKSAISPQNYMHDFMLLAIARFLHQVGNRVELVPAKGGGERSPDLRLHVSPIQILSVETKCPEKLDWDAPQCDEQLAAQIVRNAWRKAGTGASGQLSPDTPGLLAIGAFGRSKETLENLHKAARAQLQRQKKAHVVGIIIACFAFDATRSECVMHFLPAFSELYAETVRVTEVARSGN